MTAFRGERAATVVRKSNGQFAAGWRGGPGRPPGKRNYLTEVVLEALAADFSVHGPAVIETVRKTKPTVYLQVAASLCPRQVQTEKLSLFSDVSDAELALMEELLTASRASSCASLSSTVPRSSLSHLTQNSGLVMSRHVHLAVKLLILHDIAAHHASG